MARDISDDTPIENRSQLADYIATGCKPPEDWRIGTEHEKFGFYTDDLTPIPYEGERGIGAILQGMQTTLGWDPIFDNDQLIGLYDSSGGGAISIEPGGQFELSGAPLENLHQTCSEANQHLHQLNEVTMPMGIGFLGVGSSPKWSFAETPQMPKSRYDIMRAYMPKVGSLGLQMMHRTATIQVNLDFSSQEDMAEKLRIAFALQPIATAIFANSPFLDGKPTGYLSYRSEIWRDTDNNRAGILDFVFKDNFGFQDYVNYALDVPMYFVKRGSHYHDATGLSFRDFLDGRLPILPGEQANMGDWDNHISTIFPEARLRRFVEMRGADGGPWRGICALPAFWVGLIYDANAQAAASELIADWSADEVKQLRDAVPKSALNTEFRGRKLLEKAKEVIAISRMGLKNRARLNKEGADERGHLAQAEEIVASGRTRAEVMLNRYFSDWDESVDPIFAEFAFLDHKK